MSDLEKRLKIIHDLDKNILVKASAGSGKTTILVERIVALIESGVNIDEIVAVTFTLKAANEFYERLYHKLELRSRVDFLKERDDKYSLLDNPSDEQKRLDKIALNNIDSCFLGTIDSFVQRIIKEHPLEALVPSSTNILTDEDLEAMLLKAQSTLESISEGDIAKYKDYFNQYSSKGDFVSIATSLINYIDYDFLLPSEDIDSVKDRFLAEVHNIQKGLRKLNEYLSTLQISKHEHHKDSVSSWKNFSYYKNKLLGEDINDPYLAFRIFNKKNFPALDIVKNDNVEIFELSKYIKEEKKYYSISIDIKERNELEFLSSISYPLMVIKDILSDYQIHGKITFSHALKVVVEMLRKDDGKVIDVISSLQNKYKYFLIDESQDTDINQYELFLRLTAKENKENIFDLISKDKGSLFIVGDKKQSIYHFKGADVSTYMSIHDKFLAHQNEGLDYEIIELENNFRSDGNLVDYFNNVFVSLMGKETYSLVPKKENKIEFSNAYTYETNLKDNPLDIVGLIVDIVSSGKYSYKDFMLIASSKNKVKILAKALLDNNIPFFSEGNISYDVEIISSSIALFDYIVNPTSFNKYRLLTSPLFDADISRPIKEDVTLFDEKLLPRNDELPSVYLTRLIKDDIMFRHFSLEGMDVLIGIIHLLRGEEYEGNILSFKDAYEFLDRLLSENIKERFALIMNNVNAVHIANTHKVKGLQNKVVILAYSGNVAPSAERYINNQNKTVKVFKLSVGEAPFKTNIINPYLNMETDLDYENELNYIKDENKRLLYVAATRAEHILLIPKADKPGVFTPLYQGLELEAFPGLDYGHVDLSENHVKKYFDPNFNKNKRIKDSSKKSFNIKNGSKSYIKFIKDEEAADDFFTVFDNVSYVEDAPFDSKLFGTLVHRLMEYISKRKFRLSKDVVNYVIDEFMAYDYKDVLEKVYNTIYSGGYIQETCPFSDIYQMINEFVTYPEVPFSYRIDDNLYYGIIDLLIVKDDEIIVIDYKTDTFDVDHSSQLEAYVNAIKQFDISKGKKVSAYIYNIKEEKYLSKEEYESN